MIDKYHNKVEEKGVSPVIGVILLVAVTVALVALATVIVFDIGSDVSDTADATVQMEQTVNGDGDGVIKATVVRNSNVASFNLQSDSETGEPLISDAFTQGDVGSSATYEVLEDGDSVSVVATLEDGSEEVLTSTDYNDSDA